SGEHGSGLSRTWYVRKQFGSLCDVFREVKRIFDPHNLFNPGKVIADAPQPITKHLRTARHNGMLDRTNGGSSGGNGSTPLPKDVKPLELHLVWNDRLAATTMACNGCGRCRTQS